MEKSLAWELLFLAVLRPKLMIQFDERIKDPNIGKIGADPEYDEKGTDPKTYRKFQMTVWVNEAATAKDRKSDRVDWFQRKEFEGKTADEVAKRTLQYLKTKVKRMAKEGIDIEKASMGAVIKDFQDSDAPQFKGKSDKKRKEMAIAAKLSAKKKKKKQDDPKSKKKDKINLKPKMDEKMKNYKDIYEESERNTLKNEDADADMKAARENKDRERKRAAASRQTDAYRGIEKGRPTKDNHHFIQKIPTDTRNTRR